MMHYRADDTTPDDCEGHLSCSARNLLRRIGEQDDASMYLHPLDEGASSELIHCGLAILIPISTGGHDIALTAAGVAEHELQN